MSKEMGIIVLGIWVFIVPYLGVPDSWRTILIMVSGATVALLGFLLRGDSLSRGIRRTEHHPFAESDAGMSDSHHENRERITSLN